MGARNDGISSRHGWLTRTGGPLWIVVTIFSIICLVIAWLRSRDRAGTSPSWRRRVRAMGWGLLLLPIAWIAMWLFGVNPATVGLLLLSAAVLIMAPGIAADLAAVLLILLGLYGLAAAFAVFKQGRQVAEVANAVSVSAAPAPAAVQGRRRPRRRSVQPPRQW